MGFILIQPEVQSYKGKLENRLIKMVDKIFFSLIMGKSKDLMSKVQK